MEQDDDEYPMSAKKNREMIPLFLPKGKLVEWIIDDYLTWNGKTKF